MNKLIKKKISNGIKTKVGTPLELGAVGLLAAGAFLAISEDEKNTLEYARYEVDGKGKVADNVRILFLTDLHEKVFGNNNDELLEMIDKADPDAVLIGGDMIVASKHDSFKPKTSVTTALCSKLSKKYPVFYANGNHEQRLKTPEFRNTLEKMGVTYLSNEVAHWKYNISISGLNLANEQYRAVIPEAPDINFIDRRLGVLDEERFNIMLPHSPLFIRNYAKSGADLVLAGHFHGGTIRLPGEVGLMTPQYQFFNTNVVGEKHFEGTTMVISSGLGTHSINIRINDKPQVVVVDIKK